MTPDSDTNLNLHNILTLSCEVENDFNMFLLKLILDGYQLCSSLTSGTSLSCSYNYISDTLENKNMECSVKDISGNTYSKSF